MGGRRININLYNVCEPESKVGIRAFNGVFASRVDMLACRAEILNAEDRALMKMHLKSGFTFRQIAQVAGTTEAKIARRIHRLSSKLVDGEYIKCLKNRERFTRMELMVAKDHYLDGMSIKNIGKKREMSIYMVRQVLEKARKIVNESERKRVK